MEDPFAEGREAHDSGISITRNPYDLDDPEQEDAHMLWNDGWTAASSDEEE